MRIGLDGRAAYWYRGTGIGTYTYELIYSLLNFSKENEYMLYAPFNYEYNYPVDEKLNINYINNCTNNIFWENVNNPLHPIDSSLDILHTPQNGIGIPLNSKFKNIITLHDIIPRRMPSTVSDCYLNIFNIEINNILNNIDGIITVSNFSKEDIIKEFNYPRDKIFVTHLANEEIYKPLCKEFCKKVLKKKYSIDYDYLLYVGGFSPRKNILGLINSFSTYINKASCNLKLVIVGRKGKSYEIYKKRAEELGIANKVIFTGFIPVEDMPIFYNGCKIFLYPSFYEGFGLPPLEAMSCGAPIIASNVTSIPEILGDSAYYIDPYNIDELSLAIERVMMDVDLREKMIFNGFIKSNEYTWKKTAQSTLAAYTSLIK
ncbi:glycosyltransferase family 4 protein [Clostridium grantii]|uniref:Glycosyltransferase involved in cell wall bisynthesis n=1 Tax=Clostridium grantii DSM 8605 TaxID=1121316 RepID=A0A1M5TL27_9CLOT|nr:glycosyltransferase family 1 protein [Clostridium grantii]SHH51525.1 Glycosyltransferase involved in cell wall bisynthesis [Clostridium grantii DSM 8605]